MLVRNIAGKWPIGVTKRRFEDNIKWDLSKVGWIVCDSIYLA
jgi:hypothetical protein